MSLKVSVITACYNSAQTIADNMHTVQAQSYPNIEHLLIDGLSKDNTLQIIQSLQKTQTIVISEKDQGIYDAINKGIQKASGDIIGLMHSDDVFYDSQVIEKIVQLFDADPTLEAVYGDLLYVDAENTQKTIRTWRSKTANGKDFYWGWMPAHPSFYVRKKGV
jgi:glycosyltransferase involved in cell wall biosynthesis